jgi:ubiquinone biosynthesis O-methyltransferase
MNPVRVRFIREQLAPRFGKENLVPFKQLSGLRILDAGCGGGLLSESLARLGANMVSIDPSPENIEVAKAHAAEDPLTSSIDYRVATVEDICKEEEKFDVVCSLEV